MSPTKVTPAQQAELAEKVFQLLDSFELRGLAPRDNRNFIDNIRADANGNLVLVDPGGIDPVVAPMRLREDFFHRGSVRDLVFLKYFILCPSYV